MHLLFGAASIVDLGASFLVLYVIRGSSGVLREKEVLLVAADLS